MEDQHKVEMFEASRLPIRASTAPIISQEENLQAEQAQHPPPLDEKLLLRGQERFGIYCAPCHGVLGNGEGMIVRRGFPAPPTYHSDRMREASDRHFYDVMTNGQGVMYAYRDRLSPEDRWAVVAYIRALQLSQHYPLSQLEKPWPATLGVPP